MLRYLCLALIWLIALRCVAEALAGKTPEPFTAAAMATALVVSMLVLAASIFEACGGRAE